MRVALVDPPGPVVRDLAYGCWHGRKWVGYSWPPLHLGYVAAVLEREGHEVSLAEGNALGPDGVAARLEAFAPECVVAATSTRTFLSDAAFLGPLPREGPLALFGDLPTVRPDVALGSCDLAVVGEAEAVLPALLRELEEGRDGGRAPGARVMRRRRVAGVGAGRIADLDAMPFPSRGLFEGSYSNPLAVRTPFATVLASRGCPRGCTFCTAGIVQGRAYRARSPSNLALELDALQDEGVREAFFRDEDLVQDRGWLVEVAADLSERGLPWMANARTDAIDEGVADALASGGCHLVKLGVESGSQRVLDAFRKGARVDDARRAVSLLRDRGVTVLAHLIIGAPGQGTRELGEASRFALELGADLASFDVLLPLPGTPLFAELESQGRVSLDDVMRLDAPELASRFLAASAAEVERAYRSAFRRFYLRPGLVAGHALSAASAERAAALARATAELWRGLA